jgi:membrane-anchored protein YejM (alkaline phosphatase superfamily)
VRFYTHADCTFRIPRATEWPVMAARFSESAEPAAAVGAHLDILATLIQSGSGLPNDYAERRDWMDEQGPAWVTSAIMALIAAVNPTPDEAGK